MTADISGLTITDGYVNGTNSGGGIYNDGTLTITDCTLSGNSAEVGGGISNSGTLTVTSSTISGNSAFRRRRHPQHWRHDDDYRQHHFWKLGVSPAAVSQNGGTLTITDSTISGNSAAGGGGIYNGSGTLDDYRQHHLRKLGE